MLLQRGHRKARLAVFGLGFTGARLADAAKAAGHEVFGFSRRRSFGGVDPFDASTAAECRVFASRWEPGSFDAAVVTFSPEAAHPEFWPLLRTLAPRCILLGTTGIYERPEGGVAQTIHEGTSLDPLHPRLIREHEFLEHGGIVVRLAGIYGGNRNPVRWIREGRVDYEDRQVNLVFADDITGALLAIAAEPQVESIYNLSDGQVHTWRQIIDFLVEQELLDHARKAVAPTKASAIVDNRRFMRDFPDFRFHDFWEEIGWLAREVQG